MSGLSFEYAKPEELMISSEWILNFLDRLESCKLPLHSFVLMKEGKIVSETYYEPYEADSLHRMFSITKSMVSLAIGFLEEEGKLSLDDKIVTYFSEKLPAEGPHPYLECLTIRNMLRMATCHKQTTYKLPGVTDWVGSFFTTKPSHIPGTTFSYDTASTHVLCALVEKLTGGKLMDYLRVKCLDEIGFSKEAYVLTAPGGESYGGSGLVATSMDLMKLMYVISRGGKLGDKQLIPAEYLKEALKKQIDTYAKHSTWEEMQGYGYQFWRTSHNGYCMYGMGGQYACYYPEKDVLFVTTADTQGRGGGNQLIFDAFYQEIYDKIGAVKVSEKQVEVPKTRELFRVDGEETSPILQTVNHKRYQLDANKQGFLSMELSIEGKEGELLCETERGIEKIPFGIGQNKVVSFPKYGYRSLISGAFRDQNTFLIHAQVVDTALGNLYIQLAFNEDKVTVMMRKFVEDLFGEFDGFIAGRQEKE